MGLKRNVRGFTYRNKRKRLLIEYKGGECELCGYNKTEYLGVFVFHHKDPTKKEFSVSQKSTSISKGKEEADKCMLLCCRCHAEIHAKWDIEHNQELLRTVGKRISRRSSEDCPNLELLCIECNEVFITKDETRKFCSTKCCGLYNRKVNRPTKDVLEKLLWEKPTTHISKDYGVSDKAVEAWAKEYGVSKPPRGYWSKQRANKF